MKGFERKALKGEEALKGVWKGCFQGGVGRRGVGRVVEGGSERVFLKDFLKERLKGTLKRGLKGC